MKTERREFLKKIFGGGTLAMAVVSIVPTVLSGGKVRPPTTATKNPSRPPTEKKQKSEKSISEEGGEAVDLNGSKGITEVSEDDRGKDTKQKK